MASRAAERVRTILRQVNATPGANLRQIVRYTGIPMSTTIRMIKKLEKERVVKAEQDGGFRRFYPAGGGLNARKRLVMVYANRRGPRLIMQKVLEKPGITHGALAEATDMPAPTLTYNMKPLLNNKIIGVRKAGNYRCYKIANPNLVKKVLYHTAGFDQAVANGGNN